MLLQKPYRLKDKLRILPLTDNPSSYNNYPEKGQQLYYIESTFQGTSDQNNGCALNAIILYIHTYTAAGITCIHKHPGK